MPDMPNDDFISASEIADYIYCNRAWWLKLSGYKTQNHAALTQGAAGHTQFSKDIDQVQRQEGLGRLVLLVGAALLIIFILLRIFIR